MASSGIPAHAAEWLNDYGQTGLGQIPTARGLGKGVVGFGYNQFDPYRTYNFHVQPLDWIQGNFRFVDVRDRPFGFNTGETFTDKGADIQIRLLAESDITPAVAVGLMDIGGTGLFASEYVVASRRYYNWDFHLGMGWGRLGSRADIDNPLGAVADRFDNRPRGFEGDITDTGTLNADTWFRGEAAFFGGVVWTPGAGPLSLFAEVEGNDYQSEGLSNNQPTSSRVNFGATYRVLDSIDLKLSYQRGEILAFGLSSDADFSRDAESWNIQPVAFTRVPAFDRFEARAVARPLDEATVERIRRDLSHQRIFVHAMDDDLEAGRLTIWFGQALSNSLAPAAARIGRVLIRHTGDAYREFELVDMTGGAESARFVIPRRPFHRAVAGDGSIEEFLEYLWTEPPRPAGYARAAYRGLLAYPAFTYGFSPQVRSNIGGPDEFAVGQVLLRTAGTLQLTPRWSFTGAVGINLADNIGDRLDRRFPSGLPRVRSDIGLYQRTGKDYYLAQLETNYIFPLASDVYGRFSAGIFEEMFGGVAGEVLYRPSGRRWAVGATLNRLRQRDFDQRLDFREYEVTTGHLTWYHELPWQNIRVIASAGRYLAGDVGATLDISRRFNSGVRFGVFASQTDVSSEEFGEGSFDKGFYLSIPLELFTPGRAKGATTFNFRPLSRDGGQKAVTGRALYDTLQYSHTGTLTNDPEQWLR